MERMGEAMECNHECLHCQYKDCMNDDLTRQERAQQDAIDREIAFMRLDNKSQKVIACRRKYQNSSKGKETQKRYASSEKGKAAKRRYYSSLKGMEAKWRYEQTDKAKERHQRYIKSEKGKATAIRKSNKRIKSGKNAEYCRAYYYRKKVKREAAVSNE